MMSPERLAELRALPYQEYLLTPEWQATRKRILKRDQYQCQGCHASHVVFHVHHYTYERLGCEEDTDLVTLCEACHTELHRLMAEPPRVPFLSRCGVGVSAAALGTIGIEGFIHAPLPAEIGVLIGAYLLAKNSPAIYGALKELLPESALAWLGKPPETGSYSWVDRWVWNKHRQPSQIPTEEEAEIVRHVKEEDVLLDTEDDIYGAYHRTRLTTAHPLECERDEPVLPVRKSGLFRFSELLETGWRPSWKEIFVGRTMKGKDIFVRAVDLCHVAIAGKTGGGKGSLMRLIMVQLCSIGADVMLLNPHYMRWVCADNGPEFDEDWTPFEGLHPRTNKHYLRENPVVCADIVNINDSLTWAASDLLAQRKAQGREGGVRFKPIFLVIDEWPSIAGDLKKTAPEQLAKLLREGRKFGIFVFVASQDFQVKTIGMDGGSVRKCLLTTFYTGGDLTTAKELLNDPAKKGIDIPENKLGKGVVMLKCVGTDNEPTLARVPFVDNEAVYRLLGPSTHQKGKTSEAPLTLETVKHWFEAGRINDQQFFALLSQLPDETKTEGLQDDSHTGEAVPLQFEAFRPDEKRVEAQFNERNVPPSQQAQNSPKNGEFEASEDGTFRRSDGSEAASEGDGRPQDSDGTAEYLPVGWTPEKVQMYAGFYRALNHVDKALMAIDVSQSQINRAFARTILKQQGLWKEK